MEEKRKIRGAAGSDQGLGKDQWPVGFESGFYDEEAGERGAFRWMSAA